jgi:hypothetical protein
MGNELTDSDLGFMRVALVAHLLGSADRDLSDDGVAQLVQWADTFLWARNEYVRVRHKGAMDIMNRFIGMVISSKFEVLQKAEEYVAAYDKRHG